MKLSPFWTTVTPLSKTIALILVILLPFLGFYVGMNYQRGLDQQQAPVPTSIPRPPNIVYCAQDVQTCPDGSSVTRQPPTCAFAPCPITPTASSPKKVFCGGIAGIQCPMSMTCVMDGNYPDAGGYCQPL